MEWVDCKKKLSSTYTDRELTLIEKAFCFVDEIDASKLEVSLRVAELKLRASTILAILLQDTYESDTTKAKQIRQKFGPEVIFLIKGLIESGKVKYCGIERNVESTRKMFMAMAQDVRVVIIKLLERLHYLENLEILPKEEQKRIATETLEIYAPVADRLGMGEIKLKLQDLAFKYAHPKEYEQIINEVEDKISARENYLRKKVIPTIKKELIIEKITGAEIQHRAKHHYSLWNKLLRNGMDWHRIYDLMAVRIVVDSTEQCYSVLGTIHKSWQPLPGKIKDYIALPKQNGYQSLHTTVFCVDKKITEFQIRTRKMHEEAEQGIAAHWAWEMEGKKRPTKPFTTSGKKFAWINQLRDWHKQFGYQGFAGKGFLESLKIDFFQNRVFVLTPKNEIIDLPEGATPVDFAYNVHSDIGNSMIGVKINNKIVPFSYELISGDMVEIITQKNKKVNIKMLNYAKTPSGKDRIRSALRKQGLLPKIQK